MVEPKRAAVVADGCVVNLIMADAASDAAPAGTILVDVSARECDLGWLYDAATDEFVNPSPPAPDEAA